MKLLVVRHAEAVERAPAIAEEDRWLTPRGRASFAASVRVIARRRMPPDLIVTSPLVRAVQTAELLAAGLDYDGELAVSRELAPGFDREGLARLLAGRPGASHVAIVGHEPDVGRVVADLLGRPEAVPLRKGMAVALELDPATGTARLRWVVHRGEKTRTLP